MTNSNRKMYLRSRRESFLRKRAAPECDPGTLTAWKNFSGMGGSISGGFFSLASSVSDMRNTLDVELMERCKYVSWEGLAVALLVICVDA